MRAVVTASLTLILALASGCSKFGPSSGGSGATQPANGQAKSKSPGANSPEDPNAQEKAKFVGTWTATDGEFQGVRMNAASLKGMDWTFATDKVSFTMLGQAMKATYSVQPTSNPKSFDFKGPETAIQGIYELKGDTLKVCFASTERPATFATGGTTQDTIMMIFRRAKP